MLIIITKSFYSLNMSSTIPNSGTISSTIPLINNNFTVGSKEGTADGFNEGLVDGWMDGMEDGCREGVHSLMDKWRAFC